MSFEMVSRKAELIVPENPTPHEMKTLSEVDNQESLRFYYPIIMFFNNKNPTPSMEGLDPALLIRRALAKTLVYYYPFSGRLLRHHDHHHNLMLDCTPEGVLFVEADAAVTLHQLGDTILPPCPYQGLLLKALGSINGVVASPLLLLQVTRFECGGFALALGINHVIADAAGSLQFLKALSEIAGGASSPSLPPLWERHILLARHPPRVSHAHPEYQILPFAAPVHGQNLVRKSFCFGRREIEALRATLPPECRSAASRFDLITACLWRSRSRALRLHPDDSLRITCAVSMRGKNAIELPLGFYGNAVIHPARAAKSGALCSSALDYAVRLVREARMQATGDYSRSAIDYLATMGRPSILHPGSFIVSDLSRLGFDEVDFGWGKPVYGGTMDGGVINNNTIYGGYRNREGEDVVVAPVALPVEVMERFENEVRMLIWGANERKHVVVSSRI